MTENDTILYQSWLQELQMTVDSLREQREEDKNLIAKLQSELYAHKNMVERLKVAMSQGDDYR